MAAATRITSSLAQLDPRARFFLLLVPRLISGRSTPTRLASYAAELQARGSHGLAEWCWKRTLDAAAYLDENTQRVLLDLCVGAGRVETAEELVLRNFERSGVVPTIGLELVGRLAARDRFDIAHRVFTRLLPDEGEELAEQSPAPTWPRPPRAAEIETELRALAERRPASTCCASVHAELAKLCFSFGAFGASAALFDRLDSSMPLGIEERIAHLYALKRMERLRTAGELIDETLASAATSKTAADWRMLAAAVCAAAGATDAAAAAAETALRETLAGRCDIDSVIEDCKAMLAAIARVGAVTLDRSASRAAERDAVPKLFVCGFGWSGSGALYDALLDFEGLCEMPSVQGDRYVNHDTHKEMTFVQGTAGLGQIWRKARDEGRLARHDLLELFRCHVVGGGAIGHSEHKCANSARQLLGRFGSRYSGIFRRLIEELARLPANAPLADVHSLLMDATESLTRVLSGCRNGQSVVFNNAVFGPQIDMLEVFPNFRAAVVVRDPLDQYADRRAQDIKHWMTPERFVHSYREARRAFAKGKSKLPSKHAGAVREVEFERFVRDASYRSGFLAWLSKGGSARRTKRGFDPGRSGGNIGIHARLLTDAERDAIKKGLSRWHQS